jgi:ribosomal-protein-alanine N-acetyltransferase
MHISTPSAILRDWTPLDAETLARYANNPRIALMMKDEFPSPYTLEDAQRFITKAVSSHTALLLAVEKGGQAIGSIGIHPLHDVRHRTADIGYWLAEPFWGRGIMTDAVRALIPVAFNTFDIVRLQAGIFSINPASMRVLEKCGFVREAVHRRAITKRGIIMDEVVYAYLLE